MLTCKDFYEELNNLIDDDCCQELRAKLDAHMRECSHCYVIFDTTRRTISIYQHTCCEEKTVISAPVKARLMSRLSECMAAKKSGLS